MFDQEKLRAKNKWKYVEEVPNLPFNSFEELQDALNEGKYSLDVSYIAARQLVPFIYSNIGKLGNIILQLTPLIMIVVLIIAAISLGNYLLLLWIPIPLVSSILGNPTMPIRSLLGWFNFLVFIGLLVTYWLGFQSISWLCTAFVVPFVAMRVTYRLNVRALERVLKQSEPLFLNQYEERGLRLRDALTGEELWAIDI